MNPYEPPPIQPPRPYDWWKVAYWLTIWLAVPVWFVICFSFMFAAGVIHREIAGNSMTVFLLTLPLYFAVCVATTWFMLNGVVRFAWWVENKVRWKR